jgi:L-ribulokinase
VTRIINGGGLPQRNEVLNQVYANALGKPVLVPDGLPTGLGSAIFAGIAAGHYPNVSTAQEAICLPFRTFEPDPAAKAVYDRLYALFRAVYFGFGGTAGPVDFGGTLKELRQIAGLSAQ